MLFIVINRDIVKLLPVNHSTTMDKLLDYIPDLFEKVSKMANKSMQNKKEKTDKIISTIQKKYEKDKEDNKETEIKEQIKIEDLDDNDFEEKIVYDDLDEEDDE